jgi:hypothetical protein
VGRGLGVTLGLTVGVALGVGVGVAVAVAIGVAVDVAVAVAVAVGVAVGVGVALDCAQYLPPVFKELPLYPPQTIILLPVQTAVGTARPMGELVVLVAVQLSVPLSYLPPVLK